MAGYPYRKIPLTQGRFARVDPEDYAELARHKWCAARQSNTFYAVRADGKRQVRMHRVVVNAPRGLVVDHIDHNGLHNVKRNLRQCTKSQNARNQRPQVGRSSKYAGVGWHKGDGKWYARVNDSGHQHWLGTFTSEREAAKARDEAAKQIFGRFAHLNFPKERRWTNLPARIKEQIATALGRLKQHRSGP